MTQVSLKNTDHLEPGDVVRHPYTDALVTVKEVREVPWENDRYDVHFEHGTLVLNKHAAALWQIA